MPAKVISDMYVHCTLTLLFFKERRERFTHGRSFLKSDESDLLMVALFPKSDESDLLMVALFF